MITKDGERWDKVGSRADERKMLGSKVQNGKCWDLKCRTGNIGIKAVKREMMGSNLTALKRKLGLLGFGSCLINMIIRLCRN